MTDDSRRHLTTPALLEHWDNGVPMMIPLVGEPELRLRIDPPQVRLTLRAPLDGAIELPSNPLAHIQLERVTEAGQSFLDMSASDERLLVDGYAMLTSVADRIQLQGLAPLAALKETLETWSSILARRVRIGLEAEVGLVGELLVVEALQAGGLDPRSWRGSDREEHDFGFADLDLEVKTTLGERRQHWIHGLEQLTPTGDTPLWVFSVQITRGGAEQGRTLPELVDDVRAGTSDETVRADLDDGLRAAGWNEQARDLFADRWRLRSLPLAAEIDNAFPRLTAQHLADAGVDSTGIRRVTYEIDMTGRAPSPDPPVSLASIIDQMGSSDG